MLRLISFRKVIFWIHLAAGLLAGVIILIMSATGVALTYQRQIQAWADRGNWKPAPGATALPAEELTSRLRAAGLSPTSLTIRAGAGEPASAAISGSGTRLVDPSTGAVIEPGRHAARVRTFFRWNTDWHRWLARTGESRATGKAVTGAANLIFLFIVLSGIYLWMPRRWSWRAVGAVTLFRRGLSGRARNFNWHNVAGIWTAIPLAIVVASATVISYPWATALVYRAYGETPPRPQPAAPRPAAASQSSQPVATTGLSAAIAAASAHVPEWRSITLRLPASNGAPIVATIDAGDGGQPQKRGTLTVDAATGSVKTWEPFSAQSPARRMRSLMRFAHTGEVAGIAGQTIAGIASAAGVLLVWTGFSLALHRFRAWRQRTPRASDHLHRRDQGQDVDDAVEEQGEDQHYRKSPDNAA